ncbi:MAG: hypothetical protein JOY82_23600, partial [Streptosporangiaceae bacterium]|nr:hypothetical protein [Streptosporangiaceae bacterium]MBV9857469.1 hypothetical protein [Streptosporangiaceae bacterium]
MPEIAREQTGPAGTGAVRPDQPGSEPPAQPGQPGALAAGQPELAAGQPVPVAGQPSPSGARRWLSRPRLLWCAGFLFSGVALFWCYLWQSRTFPVNSDGASNALQAWDMLHGNVLLHGWYLSDVSFYTTELPEYMLVEAVRGLGPDVVHICAALTYTLLVLL